MLKIYLPLLAIPEEV